MMNRVFCTAVWVAIVFGPSAHGQIFWAHNGTPDQIQRAETDGTGFSAIVAPTPNNSPWAVAVNPAGNQVFWSDIIGPNFTIYRAGLDGSNVTPIYNSPTSVFGMAYDGNGGLILASSAQIQRITTDGTLPTVLLTGLGTANSVTVDAAAGKMYWTEQAANRIARANLDGTDVETIVNTTYSGTTTERGIALDGHGGLYWVDSATDFLYKADLTTFGTTPIAETPLVNLAALIGGNASPNGLASDGTALYWAEGANPFRGIYKANLDGSMAALLVAATPTGGSPIGIAAVPEPSSLALLTVAGAAAWQVRRQRSAARR